MFLSIGSDFCSSLMLLLMRLLEILKYLNTAYWKFWVALSGGNKW